MQLFITCCYLSVCTKPPTFLIWLVSLVTCIAAPLHGFAFWFDVEFGGPANVTAANGASHNDKTPNNNCENGGKRKRHRSPSEGLVLSTAPEDPPTHWEQVLDVSYVLIILSCLRADTQEAGVRTEALRFYSLFTYVKLDAKHLCK